VLEFNEIDRGAPTYAGSEGDVAYAMLDWYRATLLTKCAGLGDVQLRQRAVAPSSLSLLGLLRHMSDVERFWFGWFDGNKPVARFSSDERPDDDFDDLEGESVQNVLTEYRDACRESRAICARHSLDEQRRNEVRGRDYSFRYVIVHMIEEYARHCGHADLLREVIDGTTGQ
jgi:uncharacterized damage-inducible protein DinB